MNATRHIKILSWNVRGLNDRAKRVLVSHEVQKHSPHVLCIQETKWDMENVQYIRETIGSRIDNFGLIKAKGTAGGGTSCMGSQVVHENRNTVHGTHHLR